MFISKNDLGTTMYGYQIDQIVDGRTDIIDIALQAAEEELRSYLTGNNKKVWLDGRIRYDVDAILSKTGNERNALLVKHCATIAKWWIVDLANADIIYEQAKERYDRTIDWLVKLAKGDVTMSNLPALSNDDDTVDKNGFIWGSNKKFNHDY